jgi:tRNA (mo5U34)-methyltransferase
VITNQPQDQTALRQEIDRLSPWFHNLHLPGGLQTAPDHDLGDFPARKFAKFSHCLPQDLDGWTVLDVGCNAGFYSFELARRGAVVTAIDMDPHYLSQARWAAEQLGLQDRVTFWQAQVYDVASTPMEYDLVWFMGVFYHLRYPLLALDLLARRAKRLLMFQTMTYPEDESCEVPENFDLEQREVMCGRGWPKMAFIEHRLADDPTNWWAANESCVEAMLRSCGLDVVARPAHELWLCQPNPDAQPVPWIEQEFAAAIGANLVQQTRHALGDRYAAKGDRP